MNYSNPTLLLISGPNGAGKSTHIQSLLPSELSHLKAYNRDLAFQSFKDRLLQDHVESGTVDQQALQLMEDDLLSKMGSAIKSGQHFVLETPLSAGRHWAYLDRFENAGYQIELLYLCLDSVSDCLNRVYQRTQEGGMYVDESTVNKVYEWNLRYIKDYSKTFKSISLLDGMKVPTLLAKAEDQKILYAHSDALKKNWVKLGFPNISKKIILYLQEGNNFKGNPRMNRRFRP